MKVLFSSIFVCFFLCTTATFGQQQQGTVKDSIRILYGKLFEELKANYLRTKQVDWEGIESHIMQEAL